MNRLFNVINTLDRVTGTQAPHWLAHHQPRASVCTYSVTQCPCGGCGVLPQSPGTRRRLARLLVLLPRRLLALGRAVERVLAPCARFRAEGAADVALASRLEDRLHLGQFSLVVLQVLDEGASGVVGAIDLVVLGGEGVEEEGGEGGGGDVLGGEAEDVSDLSARIVLGVLSILDGCAAMDVFSGEGKGVSMDHSKSKKHEGVAVCLAIAGNISKKFRIEVFEHFTHQLVIMLIDELVAVCIRS